MSYSSSCNSVIVCFSKVLLQSRLYIITKLAESGKTTLEDVSYDVTLGGRKTHKNRAYVNILD